MSAALLKKSLSLCESNDQNKPKVKKSDKQKTRVTKLNKNKLIQGNRKVSVKEARELLKVREITLKRNLQMLKQAKKANIVTLNKDLTDQIVERASSRRYKKLEEFVETKEETEFTEEDFKKFEAEYVVE